MENREWWYISAFYRMSWPWHPSAMSHTLPHLLLAYTGTANRQACTLGYDHAKFVGEHQCGMDLGVLRNHDAHKGARLHCQRCVSSLNI